MGPFEEWVLMKVRAESRIDTTLDMLNFEKWQIILIIHIRETIFSVYIALFF